MSANWAARAALRIGGNPSRPGSPAAAGVRLLVLRPLRVEELSPRFVHPFIRVRAEVIALGLQQIGRQTGVAVAVEVGQGRARGRHWDAELHRGCHGASPGILPAGTIMSIPRGRAMFAARSDRLPAPMMFLPAALPARNCRTLSRSMS